MFSILNLKYKFSSSSSIVASISSKLIKSPFLKFLLKLILEIKPSSFIPYVIK